MNPFMFPAGASMAPPAPQAPPPNPWGVLSNPANAQTLMNFGANMLAASGPSLQPSNFGKALGQSIAMTQQFRDQFDRSKTRQALMDAQMRNIQADTAMMPFEMALKRQSAQTKLSDLIGKVDPKDYTQESFREWIETGDYGALVPVDDQKNWSFQTGVYSGKPTWVRTRGDLGTPEVLTQKGWVSAPVGSYAGSIQGSTEDVGVLGPKVTNSMEQDWYDAEKALGRLMNFGEQTQDEFLSVPWRVLTKAKQLGEKWLNIELTEEERAAMSEFEAWRSTGLENLNRYIKEITGAQMSIQEAARIRAVMPDPGEGVFDADSLTKFRGKFASAVKMTQAIRDRAIFLRQRGIPMPAPNDDAGWRRIEGAYPISAFMPANAPETPSEAAEGAQFDEQGLGVPKRL